ncbi:hypothetical protein K435DRAFT_779789 [Dendrothele bispora CBS 962.96]|uniref:Uncharacterized protein n=1 Tax=Dendrothele bispora (strain CBS 962.96) TaxID=1314807 RepID=A0A4S8LVI1_DENBC|nr:hypothetical protein K435DRAFT_779789 [Dendrothele bispora CBS 962.96]
MSSSSSSSPSMNNNALEIGVGRSGPNPTALPSTSTLQSCISRLETILLPGTRHGVDTLPDLCDLDSSFSSVRSGTQRPRYISRTASQLSTASITCVYTTSSQFSTP